ncbi:MAG TPA: alpha/beta fold hydrolase [Puia sp.]|jgi:alpha-beta hydrolase superfamily lysophospholipase|nr:alpha/beta fold hydrolase [Puia sp.]
MSNTQKRFKKTILAIVVFFILLNLFIINQAYHFTHFYEQGSVKTISEQTDGFWGQMKVALFGLKLQKLYGSTPDSPFVNVKLKTKEGLILDAWYFKVPNAKGTIAIFHGHGSEKSANLSQSDEFNEMGYSTFLVDFRAHGQSEGNTCTVGYRESEDVKLVYDYLKVNKETNVILYGISMGAATITRAVAEYNLKPTKIILEMPFSSLPNTVKGKMRVTGVFAKPLAGLLTFWGGIINGFWAFDMKPNEYVKKITCPVLLQWGKKDQGVTEAEINDLFKNISSTKELVVYEKSGHQNLCENEPDKWEENVGNFLDSIK